MLDAVDAEGDLCVAFALVGRENNSGGNGAAAIEEFDRIARPQTFDSDGVPGFVSGEGKGAPRGWGGMIEGDAVEAHAGEGI